VHYPNGPIWSLLKHKHMNTTAHSIPSLNSLHHSQVRSDTLQLIPFWEADSPSAGKELLVSYGTRMFNPVFTANPTPLMLMFLVACNLIFLWVFDRLADEGSGSSETRDLWNSERIIKCQNSRTVRKTHFITAHFVSFISTLILFSRLWQNIPNSVFPSGSQTDILYSCQCLS
jgi:hypothetical protein